MANITTSIDDFVLAKCTKFAHWFQRMTGRTNYFIAKFGVMMVSATIVLRVMNYFQPIHKLGFKTPTPLLLLYFLLLVDMFFRALQLDKLDETSQLSEERVRMWTSNTRFFRLVFLYFAVTDTVGVFLLRYSFIYDIPTIFYTVGFSYGLTIFYYFAAVDPLPPQKSRVRQWLESFMLTPATAKSEI